MRRVGLLVLDRDKLVGEKLKANKSKVVSEQNVIHKHFANLTKSDILENEENIKKIYLCF